MAPLFSTFLAACLCSGLPVFAQQRCYDGNTAKVSAQAEIFQVGYGSYVLHCQGSFKDGAGETFSFHLRGLVSPIQVAEKSYFLGAGHVFDVRQVILLRGCSLAGSTVGPPEYFLELQGRRYDLARIDNGCLDLALFELQGQKADFPRSRYGCGDSDDLRPGNHVLSWGLPLMEGFELSVGVVSALAAPRSLLEASFPGASAEDFFVTSMPTIFGCSGALVYAFREGEPEIVGMLVAGYLSINRSIVYRINSILRESGLR